MAWLDVPNRDDVGVVVGSQLNRCDQPTSVQMGLVLITKRVLIFALVAIAGPFAACSDGEGHKEPPTGSNGGTGGAMGEAPPQAGQNADGASAGAGGTANAMTATQRELLDRLAEKARRNFYDAFVALTRSVGCDPVSLQPCHPAVADCPPVVTPPSYEEFEHSLLDVSGCAHDLLVTYATCAAAPLDTITCDLNESGSLSWSSEVCDDAEALSVPCVFLSDQIYAREEQICDLVAAVPCFSDRKTCVAEYQEESIKYNMVGCGRERERLVTCLAARNVYDFECAGAAGAPTPKELACFDEQFELTVCLGNAADNPSIGT